MCLPIEWATLTREERLMEMKAVREHHLSLANAIHEGWLTDGRSRGAEYEKASEAYDAHTAEHKAAAKRMRAARIK